MVCSANAGCTCLASSRVGSSTITLGCRPKVRRPLGPMLSASFSTIGNTKASVLPHPVRARPTMSFPASNNSSVWAYAHQVAPQFETCSYTERHVFCRYCGSPVGPMCGARGLRHADQLHVRA